jgi:rfaE bifunctional protein nucleotidyltransferase chain/domain
MMSHLSPIKAKILDQKSLDSWLAIARFKKQKIVFTNGCFDVLHHGHIVYLSKAADAGDKLIIGLNSDDSVRKLKGNNRPVMDQDSRALILASLHFVSAVIIFNEDTPYKLIEHIKPDVLVKGGDYKTEEIVGYDIVKAKGGEVITVDYIEGYSSSALIGKMSGNHN